MTRAVAVSAEWARWGSTADGVRRMLDCSRGAIGADRYEQVLNRYLAGTPESLPQVIIGWLRYDVSPGSADAGERHVLALVIHDEVSPDDSATAERLGAAVPSGFDSAGRPAPLTRCYFVPFEDLAAGLVSYAELYGTLGAIRLPCERGRLIPADLAGGLPLPDTPLYLAAAAQAAALLLTGRPVCIEGSRDLTVADRLRLLDTAASLLPYGLRSELSAATWVSGTSRKHRFRLYFSSTARTHDNVINLARLDAAPSLDPVADRYLTWLLNGDIEQRRNDLLTAPRVPLRFGDQATAWLDDWTRRPVRRKSSTTQLPRASPTRPSPEQAIRDYADRLLRGDAGRHVDVLQRVLAQGLTAEDQENCRHVIRESRLLRPGLTGSQDALAEFYRVVIPRVFGPRLDYAAVCDIIDCAGIPAGDVLPEPLITVVAGCEFDGRLTQVFAALLELRASGGGRAGSDGLAGALPAVSLVALVAGAGLHLSRPHRDLVWSTLTSQPGLLDPEEARAILLDQRFYSRELVIWTSDNTEEQANTLGRLLRLAYDCPLGRRAVEEIVAHADTVTDALAAAVAMNGGSSLVQRKGRWELRPSDQTGTTTGLRQALFPPRMPGGPGVGTPAPDDTAGGDFPTVDLPAYPGEPAAVAVPVDPGHPVGPAGPLPQQQYEKYASPSGGPSSDRAGEYSRPLAPLAPRAESRPDPQAAPALADRAVWNSGLPGDRRLDGMTAWQMFRTPVLVTMVLAAVVLFFLVLLWVH
jgi:hypothetical protein